MLQIKKLKYVQLDIFVILSAFFNIMCFVQLIF